MKKMTEKFACNRVKEIYAMKDFKFAPPHNNLFSNWINLINRFSNFYFIVKLSQNLFIIFGIIFHQLLSFNQRWLTFTRIVCFTSLASNFCLLCTYLANLFDPAVRLICYCFWSSLLETSLETVAWPFVPTLIKLPFLLESLLHIFIKFYLTSLLSSESLFRWWHGTVHFIWSDLIFYRFICLIGFMS